jgi:hypothetical protein
MRRQRGPGEDSRHKVARISKGRQSSARGVLRADYVSAKAASSGCRLNKSESLISLIQRTNLPSQSPLSVPRGWHDSNIVGCGRSRDSLSVHRILHHSFRSAPCDQCAQGVLGQDAISDSLRLLTSSSRWKVSASTIPRTQLDSDDSNTLTFTNYPILDPRQEIFAQGLARGSSTGTPRRISKITCATSAAPPGIGRARFGD